MSPLEPHPERRVCENCGVHQPMHHGDRELCCGCYVKAGNAPADWHSVCLETYFGFTNAFNEAAR